MEIQEGKEGSITTLATSGPLPRPSCVLPVRRQGCLRVVWGLSGGHESKTKRNQARIADPLFLIPKTGLRVPLRVTFGTPPLPCPLPPWVGQIRVSGANSQGGPNRVTLQTARKPKKSQAKHSSTTNNYETRGKRFRTAATIWFLTRRQRAWYGVGAV